MKLLFEWVFSRELVGVTWRGGVKVREILHFCRFSGSLGKPLGSFQLPLQLKNRKEVFCRKNWRNGDPCHSSAETGERTISPKKKPECIKLVWFPPFHHYIDPRHSNISSSLFIHLQQPVCFTYYYFYHLIIQWIGHLMLNWERSNLSWIAGISFL